MNTICSYEDISSIDFAVLSSDLNASLGLINLNHPFPEQDSLLVLEIIVQDLKYDLPIKEDPGISISVWQCK